MKVIHIPLCTSEKVEDIVATHECEHLVFHLSGIKSALTFSAFDKWMVEYPQESSD